MRIAAACAAAIMASVLAAGCFEGKGDFTINPDGSGKVVLDVTFPASPPWMAAPASATARATVGVPSEFPTARPTGPSGPASSSTTSARTPEDDMRDACYKILKQSVGVDAWKDVSFERAGTGPIHFKATAYFKDLARVRLYPDAEQTRMGCGPDGDALLLVLNKPTGADDVPSVPKLIAPADLAKQMKAERDSYNKAKGDLALEMSDLRLSLTFHVPGEPTEIKGLTMEEGALIMTIDGSRLLSSMDGPMADNAYLRDRIFAGRTFGAKGTAALRDHFIKKALECRGEAWARMTGNMRVQFDYESEVDAAKKAYPDMLIKLGLEKPKPVRPSTTGTGATSGAGVTPSSRAPAPAPAGTTEPGAAQPATPTTTKKPVTIFGPPTVTPKPPTMPTMPASPPSVPVLPPLP